MASHWLAAESHTNELALLQDWLMQQDDDRASTNDKLHLEIQTFDDTVQLFISVTCHLYFVLLC